MYQKIMVPLDGSLLAECVLPHVEAIAGGCGVKDVIFVRVIEPFRPATVGESGVFPFSDEELKRFNSENMREATDYLDQVVGRTKYGSARGRPAVIMGLTADSLVDYAVKNDVDLIVMSTHGRSGVSRWVWGSVADRILRAVCVPVLMVRAPGCVLGV